jgi:hypothetical protein
LIIWWLQKIELDSVHFAYPFASEGLIKPKIINKMSDGMENKSIIFLWLVVMVETSVDLFYARNILPEVDF